MQILWRAQDIDEVGTHLTKHSGGYPQGGPFKIKTQRPVNSRLASSLLGALLNRMRSMSGTNDLLQQACWTSSELGTRNNGME